MKLLLLLLLMCSAAFGQTEFTAIRLKNDPVTVNDTTKVNLLARENDGPNKGLIRKVTWSSVAGIISDMITEEVNPLKREITDLPRDFFISCNYTAAPVQGDVMYYITDTVRSLDIKAMMGRDVYASRSVTVIDKNTISVIGELLDEDGTEPNTGNYFLMIMKNCKLVDNALVIGSYNWIELPGVRRHPTTNVPYNVHSAIYHRDFLYYVTRVNSGITDNTQIIKVNPWDLTDVKYVDLPTTAGYNSAVGCVRAYKNNLYLLSVSTLTGNTYASMIRVDENLQDNEILFQCGNVTSAQRVVNSSPFLIYKDKVYIPYRYNDAGNTTLAYNTLGFFVYDLYKGTEITNTGNLTITTGATAAPVPHWMSIFNGKLLIHTAGTGGANKQLVRFDLETLTFEAAVAIPWGLTNENSITKEGYVLLNNELSYTRYLYKIKYNDFSDFTNTGFLGWYSLGAYDWNDVYEESLKTKLSQFKNDLSTGTVTNVSVVPANGISGSVATATTTPAITLTLGAITPTSIGSATTATTQAPGDNSTRLATTGFVAAAVAAAGGGGVADAIVDGVTTISPSQNAVFDALALTAKLTGNSNITFQNGMGLRNDASTGNFSLTVGSSTTSATWTRNMNDAIPAAVFNNNHATSTGAIVNFNSVGTTQVSITKTGNVYFPSSSDGIVLTAPDGTKYLVTIANGGTLQTSTITTP